MNKKILLLLLFLTILACSSKSEKSIPEKQLQGWAGNPDNPNEKPFDYFYLYSRGRASEKAIQRRSGIMMKTTCTDSATTSGIGNLGGTIIGETIPSRTYPSGQLYQSSPLNSLSTLYHRKYSEVYFQDKSNSFSVLNLVTVTGNDNGWGTGRHYSISKIIKEMKVKECKPRTIQDPEILGSEWKECECIVYAYIQGGRDTVMNRVREIDRE